MDGVIKEFINNLTYSKPLSKNTVESYSRDLKQFLEYLNNEGLDYKKVKRTNIIAYTIHLQKKGKATSSILRTMATIRAFYKENIKKGIVDVDPTIDIDSPKIEKIS